MEGIGPRTILVEHYWPGVTIDRFEAATKAVDEAVADLAARGVRIRLLRSWFVPEDEAAFCVFEAESRSVVEEALRRAAVPFERVLDAPEVVFTNIRRRS